MANIDSSEKSTTVREIAERTAKEFEGYYRENPALYHDVIIDAIKAAIREEVQRAATDVLADQHRPNINRLMEIAIKEWLSRGDIVLASPSAEVLKKINGVLSALATDDMYLSQTNSAVKLKAKAYRLRCAGATATQIANKLGVSKSDAMSLLRKARNDIEQSKRWLDLYRVSRPQKKR